MNFDVTQILRYFLVSFLHFEGISIGLQTLLVIGVSVPTAVARQWLS